MIRAGSTLSTPPSSIFGGQGTAVHLGNSISEVDPTYALQNAFDRGSVLPGLDGVAAFDPPQAGYLYNMNQNAQLANNTQVDNAGIDVRLTQLRESAGRHAHRGSDVADQR